MSDHDHGDHAHHHGHANDRGLRAVFRYLRWAPEMWRSDINDAVVELVAPSSGERVIDIGAGMGPATVQAAARGATVVAVEPTPFMRTVLRARRLVNRQRKRIHVVDGAAEATGAADFSADAVWSVNAMHHWVDADRAAAEIARVLKPGGRVVLLDEDFDDPTHPDFERFGDHGGLEHHGFAMVDAERMGERLRASGLVDIDAGKRDVVGRPSLVVSATKPG